MRDVTGVVCGGWLVWLVSSSMKWTEGRYVGQCCGCPLSSVSSGPSEIALRCLFWCEKRVECLRILTIWHFAGASADAKQGCSSEVVCEQSSDSPSNVHNLLSPSFDTEENRSSDRWLTEEPIVMFALLGMMLSCLGALSYEDGSRSAIIREEVKKKMSESK